eukprot:144914-Chlamydomonas_euryale.AAC.4
MVGRNRIDKAEKGEFPNRQRHTSCRGKETAGLSWWVGTTAAVCAQAATQRAHPCRHCRLGLGLRLRRSLRRRRRPTRCRVQARRTRRSRCSRCRRRSPGRSRGLPQSSPVHAPLGCRSSHAGSASPRSGRCSRTGTSPSTDAAGTTVVVTARLRRPPSRPMTRQTHHLRRLRARRRYAP